MAELFQTAADLLTAGGVILLAVSLYLWVRLRRFAEGDGTVQENRSRPGKSGGSGKSASESAEREPKREENG
ncbi:MAG: hypothetical protein ACOYBC_07020 [Bilifractor sp.]